MEREFGYREMRTSYASGGIQLDHAAMNETSPVMALRPDLIQMEGLPADLGQWPIAVGGEDPRVHASPELGRKAIGIELNPDYVKLGLKRCQREADQGKLF